MTIRCLSLHARYRCQHSGACCTAGWPIPVEAGTIQILAGAVAGGRLTPARSALRLWTVPADAPSDTPAVLHADGDGCIFFDRGASGCCRIHGTLGPAALPLACREFPRISLADPRGTSVTLSHYCPTAAGLLDVDAAVEVTTDAAAFPNGTVLTGLDVRDRLPPLLRPDMLMDWSSWWTFERRAVALFDRRDELTATTLARLASIVEQVRSWAPADESLPARIDRAFLDGAVTRGADGANMADERLSDVLAAIPADLRPPTVERPGRPADAVIRRFVAAHAFANWTAHLGQGLRSWLRSIEAAHALVSSGLGVRQTDLLLRHLADPRALATAFSRAESE